MISDTIGRGVTVVVLPDIYADHDDCKLMLLSRRDIRQTQLQVLSTRSAEGEADATSFP